MKNKKQLVFRDQIFESECVNYVSGACEMLNGLVKEFNFLGLGDVQPNELSELISNPKKLFDKKTLSIEVPKGLSRVRYLELCELPSIAGVLQLRDELLRNPHAMSFELFELEGAKVTINDSALSELLNSRNLFLAEDEPAFKYVSILNEFIRVYNSLNEISGYSLIQPTVRNQLNNYVLFSEIEQGKFKATLNRERIMNFIKICEVTEKRNQLAAL